jgi:tetratricopeptide (TPR) repeat protein
LDGAAWLVHVGDLDAARELTARAHERLPDDLAAMRLHAWGLVVSNDIEAGAQLALESTKVEIGEQPAFGLHRQEPLSVQFLDRIVTELAGVQRFDAAIELCRAGLAQAPESLMTKRRLSLLLVRSGDPALAQEGIALIEHTIEIDPSSVGAHYALALACASQTQFDKAYVAMKTAIAMHPPNPASPVPGANAPGPWYMQMSEICMMLGRDEEAQHYAGLGETLMQR